MPDRPRLASTPLSILDLAHLRQGGTAEEAFHNSRVLAQHAESLGYKRFWLAEHHNIHGVACSATSVLIGYIANATSKIRVGSGGIMLPNHAPLVIAEQFGTLESLFPGRIDLGLGRAPGGDSAAARALRRSLHATGETISPNLWTSCAAISANHNLRSACMRILGKARTFRYGFSDRVTSVPVSPENSDCHLRLLPIFSPGPCCQPFRSIARCLGLHRSWIGHTPWLASRSWLRILTSRHNFWPQPRFKCF